jgi:hypothetical protein
MGAMGATHDKSTNVYVAPMRHGKSCGNILTACGGTHMGAMGATHDKSTNV